MESTGDPLWSASLRIEDEDMDFQMGDSIETESAVDVLFMRKSHAENALRG
ncbi:hypothetical protein PISMIDRAFT_19910 [Pisolithus microcarpus 441]|uniref:Uncharacterized protein n=1 Tax=Pisolithus microcarpus 441 TaxID=765257 RepID=A0A0C9XFC5_9AGAM|nr:hypothetical protein PISMIDRAFT_19910 [Pisolithus microcarpus 441]